jgi:hypothetical protein
LLINTCQGHLISDVRLFNMIYGWVSHICVDFKVIFHYNSTDTKTIFIS